MVLTCPRCGKEVQDPDPIYCPYCRTPLKSIRSRKTGLPTAGGILTIIAACLCIVWGIMGMAMFLANINYSYYYYGSVPVGLFLADGILGLLGFAGGLAGGILSLKRRNLGLSLLGACLTMLSGLVVTLTFGSMGYGFNGWAVGLMFGIPTIVLSMLSLIFIGISGAEFYRQG